MQKNVIPQVSRKYDVHQTILYPILFWCFSSFLSYNFQEKSKNAKKLNSNTLKSEFLFEGST